MPVGYVLGSENARPLEFWVLIKEGEYLELDDIVSVTTSLPDGRKVTLYGIVDLVQSKIEPSRFGRDTLDMREGLIPASILRSAHVSVTRVEPEIFVPPEPGLPVERAAGEEREAALYVDLMKRRFPLGLSRDGQPVWGNLEFLDGTRGAHINVSGISGVATKTSYLLFLLYALFNSPALGPAKANTHALVFNVKGEDLLWLDHPNRFLRPDEAKKYEALGLVPGAFENMALWVPPRPKIPALIPDAGSRQTGLRIYFWSLEDFCRRRMLRFLFAEAEEERSQIPMVVQQVERFLAEEAAVSGADEGAIQIKGAKIRSFGQLVDFIANHIDGIAPRAAPGTQSAFVRRLEAAVESLDHLIRAVPQEEAERHKIEWLSGQINVIDIHNLKDRAKRFVVGAVLSSIMEYKDRTGTREPLVFLLLDELNKYAPREGWSPIKEMILDIAERGRSLGIILFGAQQTASEVERRVVANASFRVIGRLDAAEVEREEYGFMPAAARARSIILKPGTMYVQQPDVPIPLLIHFPFPSWATRSEEALTEIEEIPRGFVR